MGIKCKEITRTDDQRIAEERFQRNVEINIMSKDLKICPKKNFSHIKKGIILRVPFCDQPLDTNHYFHPEEVEKYLQTLPDEHKQLKKGLKLIKERAQQMGKDILYIAFRQNPTWLYSHYYVITWSVTLPQQNAQTVHVIDEWYEEEGPYRIENVNAVKIVFKDGYEEVIRNYRPVVNILVCPEGVTIHGIKAYYDTKTNKVLKCEVGYLYKHYVYKDARVIGGGYIDPADSRPAESVSNGMYVVGNKGSCGTNIRSKSFQTTYGVYKGSPAYVQVSLYGGAVEKIEVLEA